MLSLASSLAMASPPPTEGHTTISVPLPEEFAHTEFRPGDPSPLMPGPTVVYLNLDGAPINGNGEDSRTNSSWVAADNGFTGPYPPWGGSAAQRQSLLDAVRADWMPFNFVITDQRPASGNYTMAMHGPVNHPFGPGTVGIAPVDCYDDNRNNIVYAFYSAAQLGGPAPLGEQATTVGQEIAHSFGLEHVSGNGAQSDIMYPTTSVNASFLDTCFPITGALRCSSQHSQFSGCGNGSTQNSYQELTAMFGPNNPDNADPSVHITAPSDGATVQAGSSFEIVVEASDDVQVTGVELFINGNSVGIQASPPYAWPAQGIPEGSHELYAIAGDPSGNEAESAVVTLHATADGEPDGGTGGGDGAFPGDAFPPGYGDDRGDAGCGCRAADAPAGGFALWLLVVSVLRRRAGRA
jgi:hypothetical protein